MTRTSRTLIAVSILAALALSAAAVARDDGMFKMADANKDGRISAQEHTAGMQAKFAKIDADADGTISASEMADGRRMRGGTMHEAMLARMDTNGDGVLTSNENAAAAQARFERMDTNRDGRITTVEMAAAHNAMMGAGNRRRSGMQQPDDAAMPDYKGMKARHGPGGMRGDRMAGMGQMMDANKDGTVTRAEHEAGGRARFTRMDSNKDGYLSADEIEAGRKMKHSR